MRIKEARDICHKYTHGIVIISKHWISEDSKETTEYEIFLEGNSHYGNTLAEAVSQVRARRIVNPQKEPRP